MDSEIVNGFSSTTTTFLPDITNGSEFIGNLSNIIESPLGYCGTSLKPFQKWYGSFHSYTSLTICVLGVIANILNLIVFTRKSMRNPTNIILAGLALADLLKTLEYVPYAIYLTFPNSRTYAWAVYVLFHSNFSQICHTASILLTVTLACWRYIMIANFGLGNTLCSRQRAKWAVGFSYMSSPLLCIPIYLSFSVKPSPLTRTKKAATYPEYVVNLSDLADQKANFWFYSVVIKIIPCILLTVLSLCLIYSIIQAKKRKQILLASSQLIRAKFASARTASTKSEHGPIGSDLVTRMLLAVNLLFLMTEFPQGILGLVSAMLGDIFFKSCYIPLSDVMDFMALLNSALNFILYYLMSSKFRETVRQLFFSCGDRIGPTEDLNRVYTIKGN
ncbi:Sex peptide receptor [Orchesella cincta]|uniref:Sex peptide receptor n=1 Tax=Orchesella cincta TaxID=48709 RepID=A0A1D2MJK8_ORCCI|nr:Sex peptide receptor [Orchesella cincta]